MADPYITPADAATITGELARLFPTFKLLGNTANLTLWRDSEEDGGAVAIGSQNVQIVFARREVAVQSGQASVFVGADGELRKEAPFDVASGDRFTLPEGLSGRISVSPLPGLGFIRAPFVVEG